MDSDAETSCPVCGGRLRPYRRDWLRRCDTCGVLRSNFEINIPATAGQVLVDESMREAGLETLRRENNGRLLARLAALKAPPARLLDVGSGPGFLLAQARDVGFQAEGVEPDANTVEAARAGGATVRHGYFPDVLEAGETFDVIVFNDVLEHIPDLDAALTASVERLSPGGVLCLNCPDRDGFYFRTATVLDTLGMGGALARLWQRGLPSPHIWYFTANNLSQALKRHGLNEIERLSLDTVGLNGLWARIRCVKSEPLLLSVAAYLFAVATYPLARLMPSDAQVCFFRKP